MQRIYNGIHAIMRNSHGLKNQICTSTLSHLALLNPTNRLTPIQINSPSATKILQVRLQVKLVKIQWSLGQSQCYVIGPHWPSHGNARLISQHSGHYHIVGPHWPRRDNSRINIHKFGLSHDMGLLWPRCRNCLKCHFLH